MMGDAGQVAQDRDVTFPLVIFVLLWCADHKLYSLDQFRRGRGEG
jgi:hypothetical protein